MKQKHKIIVLSFFISITILISTLLSILWKQDETNLSSENKMITNINASDIQAVALNNASGSIGLFSTSEGIFVDSEERIDYSQTKLITLVYTLSHMSAERILNEPLADLSVYGLEHPLAQASLLLEEDTIRLQLGRKSPFCGEYYCKIQGNPEIYMISSDIADKMLTTIQDLRDLSLYPTLTRENLRSLLQISISGPDETIVLRQLSTDTISSFFGMLKPVETALDWKNVDDMILNPLRQLQPQHFVSKDQPLSDYGLDTPEYTLELVFNNQVYTCAFTPKNQDTWYAANLADSLISEINAVDIEFLKTNFMDLIGNSIYTFSAADVSTISAKYENKNITLKLNGISNNLTGTIHEHQMDSAEVMNFCRKIDAIPAASIWNEDTSVISDPTLTVTISLRKGGETILEFYPVSERKCAVFINGICEFTTYTTVTDDIKKAFNELDSL